MAKPTGKKAAKGRAAKKKAIERAGSGKAKAVPRTGKKAAQKASPAKSTAASRKPAAHPLTAREKLVAIKPSGGKDNSFFDLVHEVARQIPRGRVTSYGAIGAALGTTSSARMVGWAMNTCHLSPRPVPAHRVVNSQGLLTGRHHFNPPEKMQLLLEKEGVVVKNNKIVDFKKLFWDPAKEL